MPRKRVFGATGNKAAWAAPEVTLEIAMAIGALSRGEASPAQQVLALRWIIESAAATYETSWRPERDGGPHATSFAEGRRFVGVQIVGVVNLPGEAFEELRSNANG